MSHSVSNFIMQLSFDLTPGYPIHRIFHVKLVNNFIVFMAGINKAHKQAIAGTANKPPLYCIINMVIECRFLLLMSRYNEWNNAIIGVHEYRSKALIGRFKYDYYFIAVSREFFLFTENDHLYRLEVENSIFIF